MSEVTQGGPCEVPLVELLESVPVEARYSYTESGGLKATHSIPIGRYAHEAAKQLRANLRAPQRPAPAQGVSELPTFTCDDDGAFNIEWYFDARNLLSISTEDDSLWAAWVVDGISGSCAWELCTSTPGSVVEAYRALLRRQVDDGKELRECEQLRTDAKIPKDPPIGLLMSMALRLDHALGCKGYYDQFGISHARRLEVALADMRKVYEEISGQGFYKPEREAEYAAMARESK